MKQIQCVIIDNNSESNAEAKLICERIPFIKLLKSFDNLFDAIEYLRNTPVELIICSIELNEMNGADFIANMKPCPEIIFISDNEQAACSRAVSKIGFHPQRSGRAKGLMNYQAKHHDLTIGKILSLLFLLSKKFCHQSKLLRFLLLVVLRFST